MVQKRGLGRGLSSLIPKKNQDFSEAEANYFGGMKSSQKEAVVQISADQSSTGSTGRTVLAGESVGQVDIGRIQANPYQPRKYFDEERLGGLAQSIRNYGIIQPLVVTAKSDGNFELIAGERRLEAGKIAGLEKVPVIVKQAENDEKLELAIIENIQRHNLNPIEEARAYKRMQDEFGLKQEEIAVKMGKSRSAVANILRLLILPIEIQRAVMEGKITEGHARAILAMSNPEKQRALFNLIIKENLSVRQTETKVKEVAVASHVRKIKTEDPQIKGWENQLEEILKTKVNVRPGRSGGQIQIEYYSKEEFENIYQKLTSLGQGLS